MGYAGQHFGLVFLVVVNPQLDHRRAACSRRARIQRRAVTRLGNCLAGLASSYEPGGLRSLHVGQGLRRRLAER